jgi:1,2-diacylglycerol-3-alpha-glucose alpha-1,2-galactosyltransferase
MIPLPLPSSAEQHEPTLPIAAPLRVRRFSGVMLALLGTRRKAVDLLRSAFSIPVRSQKLRLHLVSETPYVMKGQGVHTAFVDCEDLMKSADDIHVVVNQAGRGDVMHSHTYGPYYFWKGLGYKGRRILTVHVIPDSIKGSLPAWRLLMPFVRWYFRHVYSYATVCIAISPRVDEAIRELKPDAHIVQLGNPIHVDKFAPTVERRAAGRKLLGLKDDAFVVLGVGQLEGRKGVEEFLDVAQACPELTFVWAGGRPFGVMTEGIRRLNKRIAAAGAHVTFPGQFDLSLMPLIYNAADLVLFPSYQENCPLVPLEAAAAGLPVIYRDIEEYVRLYEHPYIRAKDFRQFVALTKRMATDATFRTQGQVASAQLLAQFDKAEIRSKLLVLYSQVLEAHRQRARPGRPMQPVHPPSGDHW